MLNVVPKEDFGGNCDIFLFLLLKTLKLIQLRFAYITLKGCL